MVEHVIKQSAWKRTRLFLISETEVAVLVEGRGEGSQSWDQIHGFILTRDASNAAHLLFLSLEK